MIGQRYTGIKREHSCVNDTGKAEKWWAREDSNLQPDRYERSALTIELRARFAGDAGAAICYAAPPIATGRFPAPVPVLDPVGERGRSWSVTAGRPGARTC